MEPQILDPVAYAEHQRVQLSNHAMYQQAAAQQIYERHQYCQEQIELLKAELDFVRRGHDVIGEWYG